MAWKVFNYEMQVHESRLDSFGHLNNAVYLTYFEDARWDFLRSSSYSRQKIVAEQKGPVILEVNLRFKKELTGGEKIRIESQVVREEGKIMHLFQKMILSDGVVAAEATFIVGFFDMKRRRLLAPSEEWLSVFKD